MNDIDSERVRADPVAAVGTHPAQVMGPPSIGEPGLA